jgi:hypothetical protein
MNPNADSVAIQVGTQYRKNEEAYGHIMVLYV